MQLLPLGIQGSEPIFTISLSRVNNVPVIALHVLTSGEILGSTPLTPLQETWIESQITFTATDNGNIQWLLKDSLDKTVRECSRERQIVSRRPRATQVGNLSLCS